jgi:phosphoribosylformimino-5-aminoimidazole carboxamide ribonucleotide (ProFAR) isomerase
MRVLADLVSNGVQHAMVTSVSRNGTMQGPDLHLIEQICNAVPSIAVIAPGGVGTLDDLQVLASKRARAVIAGRSLYEGRFTYQEAPEAAAVCEGSDVSLPARWQPPPPENRRRGDV